MKKPMKVTKFTDHLRETLKDPAEKALYEGWMKKKKGPISTQEYRRGFLVKREDSMADEVFLALLSRRKRATQKKRSKSRRKVNVRARRK